MQRNAAAVFGLNKPRGLAQGLEVFGMKPYAQPQPPPVFPVQNQYVPQPQLFQNQQQQHRQPLFPVQNQPLFPVQNQQQRQPQNQYVQPQADQYPIHGENSTNVVPSPISNDMYSNRRLLILGTCNAQTRCDRWLGALNGETRRGCGINALRFMGEIDDPVADAHLGQRMASPFVSVDGIAAWFNHKLAKSNKARQNKESYNITSTILQINTIPALTEYFRVLDTNMPPNSCTIVKLNRDDDPNRRPQGLTPGHFVLISKDERGKIWTYEPLTSKPGECDRREYKGTVSQGFFNAYQMQGYITASLLVVDKTLIGGGDENIEGEPFTIPDNIFNDFVRAIDDSTECNNISGGKKTKRKRKSNKKKNNTRRSYKNTRKNKYRKHI